ncbi:hypothetical protein RUM43_006759 [Polyplax serrata]|uniref:Uncharacterized protein n=1 Tax=Polyplax serrata TaxID=468196 RepID=A0AAN8S7F7_POLSC
MKPQRAQGKSRLHKSSPYRLLALVNAKLTTKQSKETGTDRWRYTKKVTIIPLKSNYKTPEEYDKLVQNGSVGH